MTDRDPVVRVFTDGPDPERATVAGACSEELVTVGPDDSLERAADLMREHAVRPIPVVDDADTPVGIVPLGDLASSGTRIRCWAPSAPPGPAHRPPRRGEAGKLRYDTPRGALSASANSTASRQPCSNGKDVERGRPTRGCARRSGWRSCDRRSRAPTPVTRARHGSPPAPRSYSRPSFPLAQPRQS
nr:CBS domain-containing protein [Streptomyces brasiliensis]